MVDGMHDRRPQLAPVTGETAQPGVGPVHGAFDGGCDQRFRVAPATLIAAKDRVKEPQHRDEFLEQALLLHLAGHLLDKLEQALFTVFVADGGFGQR